MFFVFFKQKTAYEMRISDWSSDVCSSDLYTSGELLAFDVTDGRSLWSESLAGGARGNAIATLTDIRGRPVIDRDFVVAIGNGGVMAAIDKERGEIGRASCRERGCQYV